MAGDKIMEDQLQAVWFAAGTAALIACIERAVVVSLFAHWRVWAFLALNLLLLAILFTSKFKTLENEIDRENGDDVSEFNRKERKQEELIPPVSINDDGGESEKKLPERGDCRRVEYEARNGEDDEDVGKRETQDQISKEELNQRVEAFITMFRQHLVSDAKGNKGFGKGISVTSCHGNYPGRRVSFSYNNECTATT